MQSETTTAANENEDGSDLFLGLTPDRVLEAVEQAGLFCNPVCYPLNSFENRVYEIELTDRSRVVAKFYRPGRWSEEQILEEHRFLAELAAEELPVCPMTPFPDGSTLHRTGDIWYCVAQRRGGRAPDELSDALATRLGMLAGRLHVVGARRDAPSRLRLDADTFVREPLDWLERKRPLPAHLAPRYRAAALRIADAADERSRGVAVHRLHGDLHLGNVLLRDGVLRLLDFDDMVIGPPVQDLWLALPGRDDYTLRQRSAFLEGYEQFRSFDHSTLRLIEPLRGLRLVHYAVWLARRWHDPAFQRTWPHFGTDDYWLAETEGLEEVVATLEREDRQALAGATGAVVVEEAVEALTNEDYFWDWEE